VTALDDLTTLLELACLTEDRTDREQDAMLRVAAKVDTQANALTVTNRRSGPASRMYFEVAQTRDPDQPTRMNAKTADKLRAQAERWDDQ
jgi:hypothetical protein